MTLPLCACASGDICHIEGVFVFALKRLLQSVPVMLLVVTLTFLMVRAAPGGPFSDEKAISERTQAALEARYGLDDPLWQQLIRYIQGIASGDLGPSISYPSWSVSEIIWDKLPVSLELATYSILLALLFGISLGVLAAANHGSWLDRVITGLSTLGICVPSFVLGPLLVLVFASWLNWFNVAGWLVWQDRVLPSLTLGLVYTAFIARLTRSSVVEALAQDYIRTARAKGLPTRDVVFRHALRNALLPVVSYLGPLSAALVSGSFVVETIFAIPGLGRFFVSSALDQDYFLVSGCVLFYAVALIALNFVSDCLIAWLDPRTVKGMVRGAPA